MIYFQYPAVFTVGFFYVNFFCYDNGMEKWKRIDGYDYEVSSIGRVRNLSGKILKLKTDNGYKRIGLRLNNKQVFLRVHRLVAAAFIPLIEGKNDVHHINHIRHDNRVENLQWVTGAENQYYKSANKLSYNFLLKFYKNNVDKV